jgi:3',5'-nucleoside bisphosphate phosphatase
LKNSSLSVFQQFNRIHSPGRADLHVHSTFSDGQLTPAQVLAEARAENLTALAITDHDTIEAYRVAKAALVPGEKLELISGVEITCEFGGREVHLLGYGVDPESPELNDRLREVRERRVERFLAMARTLGELGARLDSEEVERLANSGTTLSRRHLAELLLRTKQVSAIFYAFVKYLNRPEITSLPKARIPVRAGIRLVREAGGVSSWAHPPADCTVEQIREWRDYGLNAVEVEYPWTNPSHGKKLKGMAVQLGLLVTGGSDFHGVEPANRKVGSKGITSEEFAKLKQLIKKQ